MSSYPPPPNFNSRYQLLDFSNNPLPDVQNIHSPKPSPSEYPLHWWLIVVSYFLGGGDGSYATGDHPTLPTQFLFLFTSGLGVNGIMKIHILQLGIGGASSPMLIERRRLSRHITIHLWMMIRRGELDRQLHIFTIEVVCCTSSFHINQARGDQAKPVAAKGDA